MRSSRLRRAAAWCCAAMLACALPSWAALCGDTSGDGFVTSSDALKTLKLAVTSVYDRRGDVAPIDDRIGASDALKTLKDAVAGTIPVCRGAAASRAVVTTAAEDFSSGGFAVVGVASRTFNYRAGSISRDSVMRAPSGVPIVVNRQGFNTLQFLDVTKKTLPNVKECSVSDGFDSNPQDVVLVSPHKGYVTLYAGGDLLVIDPAVLFNPSVDAACKTLITGHIDLSSFDDDGVPEMDQMVMVGTDLFVTLQLLDFPTPVRPGRVVVIDTTTDTVKGSIPLSFENPFAETKGLQYDEFQNRIFVGGPGETGLELDDGGIEAINPATMESTGLLVTGADLHANIFDFVVVGTRRAFAIVAEHDTESDVDTNSVVDINLQTRTVRNVLLTSTALITDIEMTELGELWVAYRGRTSDDPPGLRIFRISGESVVPATGAPTALGQAPFTLAFLP